MNENEKNERETIEAWLDEQDALDMALIDSPETVLHEAERIIYGDREKTYGHPSKNLETIANFWSEYLGGYEIVITAKDVCVMMMLLKIARLRNDITHRDSLVDTIGYAALIERCDE
jgi:hypothetical protein